MKKALYYFEKIEKAIMFVTFFIMVIASFAQVVNRNFLKLPIPWFEEIAVYCMIYMVLIGTEFGLRDNSQVSVTAVIDRLSGLGKKIALIISKAIVVVFCGTIFYSSVGMLEAQIRSGQISPALKIPMTIPYASLTISFAIATLVQGAMLLNMILSLKKQEDTAKEV